jgi:hypothetical protein
MTTSIYIIVIAEEVDGKVYHTSFDSLYYTDLKHVNKEVKKLNKLNSVGPEFYYVRKKLTLAAERTGVISVNFDSTSLSAGKYNKEDEVLLIKFKNGSVYKYIDVPAEVFGELVAASSQGSYFAHNIKSEYEYEKRS